MWRAFWQIEARYRAGNGFAALPIGYDAVDQWCRTHDEHLAPWEIDALDRMETARIAFLNDDESEANPPMTPSIFMSMFNKGKS